MYLKKSSNPIKTTHLNVVKLRPLLMLRKKFFLDLKLVYKKGQEFRTLSL